MLRRRTNSTASCGTTREDGRDHSERVTHPLFLALAVNLNNDGLTLKNPTAIIFQ